MKRPNLGWYLALALLAVLVVWVAFSLSSTLTSRQAEQNVSLSPEAAAYLTQQSRLIIAVTRAQSPLYMTSADNTPTGFLVDYLGTFSVPLGRPVQVELMSYEDAVASLKSGLILAIADVSVSPVASAQFDFSDVYLEDLVTLFVRSGRIDLSRLADLDGHPVAAVVGSPSQTILAPRDRVKVVPVADTPSGLRAVAAGEVDAFLGERLQGIYFLDSLRLHSQISMIGEPLDRRAYALAVQKGNVATLQAVNYALANTHTNSLGDQVRNRWFGASLSADTGLHIPPEWLMTGGIVVLFFAGLGIFTFRERRMLKGAVAERTRELAESNAKYKSLIEHAGDAILLIDPLTGNLHQVNRCAETMFGRGREDLLRLGLRGILEPGEFSKTLEEFQRAQRTGAGSLSRVTCVTATGQKLLTEINLSVPLKTGAPVLVQAIARDITERVRIAEQLTGQNRFLLTLNQMTAGLAPLREPIQILQTAAQVMADPFQVEGVGLLVLGGRPAGSANFLFAGRSTWLERELHSFMLLAASQEAVRCAGTPTVYRPDWMEPNASAKWPALAPFTLIGAPVERAGRRVGAVNFLSHVPAILSDEDTRLLLALAQQLNTALEKSFLFQELQNTVEQLGAEQRFSESILNNITDGLITVDLRSRVTSANHAAEKMLDVPERGLVGQPLTVLTDSAGSAVLSRQVQAALSEGQTFSNEELDFKRGAEALPVAATISPLRNPQGHVVGAILAFADLSEIKKLENERRLMDHFAVLGRMSATLAHEIRNPLTGMSAGLQVLSPRLSTDPEATDQVNRILHEGERLNSMIEEVLAFSRNAPIRPQPSQLWLLLDMLLVRWGEVARHQGIEFVREYDRSLPEIKIDPGRLERALENLVRNALEAMQGPGTLWVTLRAETAGNGNGPQAYQVIEIANSGRPIPPDVEAKIFEPFFTTKGKGTGLGLAIAHQVAQEHGGTIAYSSAPPRAVIFTIRLPAEPESRE